MQSQTDLLCIRELFTDHNLHNIHNMEETVLCNVCQSPLNSNGGVKHGGFIQKCSRECCQSCEHLLQYFLGFAHGVTLMAVISKLCGDIERFGSQKSFAASFTSSGILEENVSRDDGTDATIFLLNIKEEPLDFIPPDDKIPDEGIPDINVFFDSNLGREPVLENVQETHADLVPSATRSPPYVRIWNAHCTQKTLSETESAREITNIKPNEKKHASTSAQQENDNTTSKRTCGSVEVEHKHNKHTKTCDICGKHFKTRAGLRGHIAAHKGAKPYVCKICGASFGQKTSWRRHQNGHTQTAPLQCDTCSKTYSTVHALNYHMLGQHQNGSFFSDRLKTLKEVGYEVDREATDRHLNHQCVFCGAQLTDGICQAHPLNCKLSFLCSHCEFVAKHVNELCQHLKKHDIPLAFTASTGNYKVAYNGKQGESDSCPVCKKQFHRAGSLKVHMKSHEEKAFSCIICFRKFSYKGSLQYHLGTHTDDRPFQCEVCQKAFKSKQLLTNHRLVHNLNESPYKCHLCGKAVTRKYFLKRHYKTVHPGVTV